MSRITISHVADRAKVSRATVSRVLNNNPTVDAEIKARVLTAIEELDYQPNRAAQRLRSNTSDVIGVIISDIQSPFFTSVVRGIEDAAYANEMNIVLCNADEDLIRQETYLRLLQAENVAGIIVSPTWHVSESNELQQFLDSGIPIILIDRIVANTSFDMVSVDNVTGAYNGVRHLIDLGYRRIGIIAGNQKLTTGKGRYEGYARALASADIPLDEKLVRFTNFTEDDGYQFTMELLSLPRPPEALFVSNNLSTMGTLKAIREKGTKVPEELALVGFDDIPMASELKTPLTVVSQPTHEMGEEAVRLLIRRLKSPQAPSQSIILQTQLIVRESCGYTARIHEKNA